jgi:hypothetical protein
LKQSNSGCDHCVVMCEFALCVRYTLREQQKRTTICMIARGYHEHVMNSDISRGCRNGENVRFGEIHTILRSHTPHTPHGLQLGVEVDHEDPRHGAQTNPTFMSQYGEQNPWIRGVSCRTNWRMWMITLAWTQPTTVFFWFKMWNPSSTICKSSAYRSRIRQPRP